VGDPSPTWLASLYEEEQLRPSWLQKEKLCEDTLRSQSSTNQGEWSQKTQTLLTPGSWIFASRIVRKYISVTLETQDVTLGYDSPSRLIHTPSRQCPLGLKTMFSKCIRTTKLQHRLFLLSYCFLCDYYQAQSSNECQTEMCLLS
jgi:hypothetical protein